VAVDEVGRGQICHCMGVEFPLQLLAGNEFFVDQVSQQDRDPAQFWCFFEKLEDLQV
jgi:hypothetical protein